MEALPSRQRKQQPGNQNLPARQLEDRGAFGRTSPLSTLPGALPSSPQACRFGLRICSALPQLAMQASELTQLLQKSLACWKMQQLELHRVHWNAENWPQQLQLPVTDLVTGTRRLGLPLSPNLLLTAQRRYSHRRLFCRAWLSRWNDCLRFVLCKLHVDLCRIM